MDQNEKKAFHGALLRLMARYNRPLGAATPDSWWEVLASYQLRAVLVGMDLACRESTQHPPSAMLVEAHTQAAAERLRAEEIEERRRQARAVLPAPRGTTRLAALEALDRELCRTGLATASRPLAPEDLPELERLWMLLCRSYDGAPADRDDESSEDVYCRVMATHCVRRGWTARRSVELLAMVPGHCMRPPQPGLLDELAAGHTPGGVWAHYGLIGDYRAHVARRTGEAA